MAVGRADSGALAPALVLFVVALASILAALGFEHIGGYRPCPLCLQERYAYYFAVPATLVAILAASRGWRHAAIGLLVAVAIGFAINTGLGIYHAGVEWKFWAGPTTCGGEAAVSGSVGSLLDGMASESVVRCDEAPLRIFGLSFAGWNAVISLVAVGLAAVAAARVARAV
ncbi:MAG: disulfide bond formation protein B [Rhizobiales bacterium]|nr:disulfide bond formation protein B [Hyphomicrobiales bacterium]